MFAAAFRLRIQAQLYLEPSLARSELTMLQLQIDVIPIELFYHKQEIFDLDIPLKCI